RGFTEMLKHHAEKAPLRRNVELREIGDTALFLASRMASGITGEVIYVDCGYNIMAVEMSVPGGRTVEQVRAPRRAASPCQGWPEEAAFRMVMHKLDHE